ncbi:DUF3899 domain-containing protein [Pontibacillus sp. ALD_SL1]|uniref:DUF3899 domain-containing protein n=1 Tax=Pontibacillus sp. ALD_SL1 TaxID=2777185 RepID=UPI001A95651D|nr:DUF3899 domain-containing protein [Pontibacillus sp. ALD_SL1]QST00815.1 DUF3899 domain-containing protein [Pontibacillus sp. ALD_SL1]
MLSFLRNKWNFLALNVSLSFVLWLLLSPLQDLFHYINVLFYLSFIYILVATILIVVRGRLFDGILKRNKEVNHSINNAPTPSITSAMFIRSFLFQGAMLGLAMAITLAVYYQLS